MEAVNMEKNPPPPPVPSNKFTPLPIEQIITPAIVDEILANFDTNVKVLRYECARGTKNGDNYLSLMYTIDVEAIRGSEPSVEVFHIMFKTIPRNPVRIAMIQPLKLFEREVLMYNEVLSRWTTTRNGAGFQSFPKCLHAALALGAFNVTNTTGTDAGVGPRHYIAMENVRHDGYKMLPRFQFLDICHAEFVVKELARFHALSYNEWHGDGQIILTRYPLLVDPVWIDPGLADPMNRHIMESSFPELLKLLRINGCDTPTCDKLSNFAQGIEERMLAVLRPPGDPKFPSVINHGDPWINNFLFKYADAGRDGGGGEAPIFLAMKFVDFQVAKVGSRILDLSYCLYTSLQIPVLNGQLEALLRLYYDTFTAATKPQGDSRRTQSWETFLEEWGVYRLYGLTMALIFAPAMNANQDDVPDFETLSMEDLMGKPKEGKGQDGGDKHKDMDKDKSNFSSFMKSPHIAERVINLVQYHI